MIYSKEEKKMWIDDWRQSGKKAWAYAKENGLIPQTFVGWVKKETKPTPGFVEIRPKPGSQTQSGKIVIEKGELKIHIPVGLSSNELSTILEGLRVAL